MHINLYSLEEVNKMTNILLHFKNKTCIKLLHDCNKLLHYMYQVVTLMYQVVTLPLMQRPNFAYVITTYNKSNSNNYSILYNNRME